MILSVIIPAFKEPLLAKTVKSLLDTSELGSNLEVLVVLDGPQTNTDIPDDPRVSFVRLKRTLGMRNAINEGLEYATGEYVMKVDAHCLFDQGFDKKMVDEMKPNWILIPRRYSLDETNWTRDMNRPARDYHYLEFPKDSKYGKGLVIMDWFGKKGTEIDDTMIFQGSCWLAQREYFMKHVGLLDDNPETYGSFAGEQHEIGLKYWLGDGAIKVNKKTWYAHLSKRTRHYKSGEYEQDFKSPPNTAKQHTYCANYWMAQPGFKDYINRFNPPGWDIYQYEQN